MNYEHYPRERIWLGWKHNIVSVQILMKTEFLLHGSVTLKNGQLNTFFTTVYGLHNVASRRPIGES